MNNAQSSIIIITLLTSLAATLPGIFLMLRGVALLSDAISHAVLPGMVIMFLYTNQLESPLLIFGAALAGLLTVLCTERIIQSKQLNKDAAIGLVFPLFFSVGILLISLYARTIHLDMDTVILGEVAFTPFNRLVINGVDYGPYAIWVMGSIALLNALLLMICYKELILTTFDAPFARIVGISPSTIYYGLMLITSITTVSALNIVGSTVVVALMLAPAGTAYLLATQIKPLIGLSILFGAAATLSGYTFAHMYNVSIAGSIACMSGVLFALVIILAPNYGLCAQLIYSRTTMRSLRIRIVCSYLTKNNAQKSTAIAHALGWQLADTQAILLAAEQQKLVIKSSDYYSLAQ